MPDERQNIEPQREDELREQAVEFMHVHLMHLAHEIRAPLHNILSLSYAVTHTKEPRGSERAYKEMKEEIYRVKRVVDNVLSAQLSSRTTRELLYFRRVDLLRLLRESISSFAGLAEERGIVVRLVTEPEGLILTADPEKLILAFGNIIHNAVKYSYSHRHVDVGLRKAAECIRIDIKNYGLGIPADELESVFLPYSRGSARDSRRSIAGTGIGLFVARQILRSHGGDITIASHPTTPSTDSDPLGRHLVCVSILLPLNRDNNHHGEQ